MKLRWASDAPTWPGKAEITIAAAKGYLAEAGIDEANIRAIPGEETAVHALVDGEVDIISGMARKALIAHSRNQPVVLVAMPNNRLTAGLAVRPDLGDPRNLRGKKVAVGVFGALVDRMARMSIERLGLRPSDVEFIEGGTGSLRIAMVETGEIGAAILMHSNLLAARKAGLKTYDFFSERFSTYAYHALTVRRETLERRRELVVGTLTAYIRGRRLLEDRDRGKEVGTLFTPQRPGGGFDDWLEERDDAVHSFTPDLRCEHDALANAVRWEQEAGLLPAPYDFRAAVDESALLEALRTVEDLSKDGEVCRG
jgi:ABC-type nitrate/sulfonate/bicarbonate transport system substrate-binding protein